MLSTMGSTKTEIAKVLKAAEQQGFTVREAKHYWIVFGPDDQRGDKPCTIGHTPSSSRSLANFVACLKRKGYKP